MVRRRPLDADLMRQALEALDAHCEGPAHLVVGGGAAMVLAYDHPLATQDVNAFAARGGLSLPELDRAAREIAEELRIAPDWLNSHFETYTHVLPSDYGRRLVPVFAGEKLKVDALGAEDLLVMKCFAARDKDRPHARRLLREAKDLGVVERRLAELVEQVDPGRGGRGDYFDDLRDEAGL